MDVQAVSALLAALLEVVERPIERPVRSNTEHLAAANEAQQIADERESQIRELELELRSCRGDLDLARHALVPSKN